MDVFPRPASKLVHDFVLVAVVLVTAACAAPGQVTHAPVRSNPAAANSAAPTPTAVAPAPTAAASIVPVDEAGAVPWVDRPGTMFFGSPLPVAPLPTDGPPCRAGELKALLAYSTGAMGDLFFWYDFTNVGPTECILRGFPRVVATRPGKPPLVATDGGKFFGFTLEPETMAPGASTSLVLGTGRDCSAAVHYPSVTVSIPGGGTVVLPGDIGPLCGLFTDQFGVQPPNPEYTKSPVDGATAVIELPSEVRAGNALNYVVDLTNPTSSDMVLTPCPSYQQGIGVASKDPLELNCAALPVLAAKTTRRFAMELAVPADFPTGPTTLYWNIAGSLDKFGGGNAAIQVDGADTPCLSDQLSAAITGPGVVPGPPNMYGAKEAATAVGLTLTNRSTTACSVRGTPVVAVTASTGQVLDLMQADQRGIAMTPTVLAQPTVVLAPGGIATTDLYWYSSWCAADPNPLTVTVTLPANGATAAATPIGGWRPPPCRDGFPGPGQVAADPLQAG